MSTANDKKEKNHRIAVLNAFLQTPHGDLKSYYKIHKDIADTDPYFYARLAVWYAENGDVRDHKELFAAVLSNSPDPEYREVGLKLLRKDLDPYQIPRVYTFFQENIKKAIPRSMKKELAYYWWELEANPSRLDGVVVYDQKGWRRVLKGQRIPHSKRTHEILFDDTPPAGSVHDVIKRLAKENDPTEQARMVVEFSGKLPLKRVQGLFKSVTPTVVFALLKVMSPQELINNMSWLQKHGANDNPDIKNEIEKKLASGKTNKRVNAMKVADAQKKAKLTTEQVKILDEVADTRLKAKGRIKRSTALLVDKSTSLEEGIEMAKRMGAMICTIMDDGVPLDVIAFDDVARPIPVAGTTLADWELAFRSVRANGSTACGAGLKLMTKQYQDAQKKGLPLKVIEQVIMVTDECENEQPYFVDAYKEYATTTGMSPHVIIVRLGGQKHLEDACKKAGITVDVYETGKQTDKYSFQNLIPLLMQKSKNDFLMEVLSVELPSRPAPVPKPAVVAEYQKQLSA